MLLPRRTEYFQLVSSPTCPHTRLKGNKTDQITNVLESLLLLNLQFMYLLQEVLGSSRNLSVQGTEG